MSPVGGLRRALRRIEAVARKEVRHLLRDHLTMGFAVGVPVLQMLLFGYAINQDVRHIRTALVDQSRSTVSRQLVGQLEASQTFDLVTRSASEDEARRMIVAGEVQAAVVVPPDYTRSYYRGRGAEILLLIDASDPVRARAARAAADGLMARHNGRVERFQIDPGASGGSAVRTTGARASFAAQPDLVRPRFLHFAVLNLYNPELRTPVFVIPALLGVILTTTMIMMTSIALVRERERGSFEFLIATPVARLELMIGKLLPYVVIGFGQIVLVVTTGLLLFRVPAQGSVADLLLVSLFFIAANLALGLVISAVSASQLQAMQMSFFFFLPSVLLSGFMFPFESMPPPAQWLGEVLPLTHFIRASRGILLRGSSFADHGVEVLAMAIFAAVSCALATAFFSKRLA